MGLAISSCSDSNNPNEPVNPTPGSEAEQETHPTILERKDIGLSVQEKEMALAQYEFPISLLKSAVRTSDTPNVTVSPLGASMVLAMIANAVDPGDREEVLEFNRPFIYFVRERSTGAVILAGVYSHPE